MGALIETIVILGLLCSVVVVIGVGLGTFLAFYDDKKEN